MLGSAKTKLPPLTLTSWVKDASPFVHLPFLLPDPVFVCILVAQKPWLRHLPPTPKPPYFSLMYHLLVLFFQTAGTAFFAVAIRNSVKPGIGRKSYSYFVLNTIISFIFANNSHLPCKGRKCQHSVLIVQALSEKATMAIWNMSANII